MTLVGIVQNKKEGVSKINKGSESRLNDHKAPLGTRMKRGCIILLHTPSFWYNGECIVKTYPAMLRLSNFNCPFMILN
jgi:hypothetical protein